MCTRFEKVDIDTLCTRGEKIIDVCPVCMKVSELDMGPVSTRSKKSGYRPSLLEI